MRQDLQVARCPVWRDDAIAAAAAVSLMLGLLLDGWNHINLQGGALGGFFTPWHGMLYAGFGAVASWVVSRNRPVDRHDGSAEGGWQGFLGVEFRYPVAVGGIAIAVIGMLGDVIWHTFLGEERGVARVIAPFHLVLFLGAALLITAPLQSGWRDPQRYPTRSSFKTLLPALVSLTLVTALVAFMLQWLSAFAEWAPTLAGGIPAGPGVDEAASGTAEMVGVARVIVTNLVLLAPVLIAVRRWRLPFGTVTAMWTTVAVYMGALTEFRRGGPILAAVAGGIVADGLVHVLRPAPGNRPALRLFAGLAPVALWVTYFLVLQIVHEASWPLDLWLGTVLLTSMSGFALTFVVVPTPTSWRREQLGE